MNRLMRFSEISKHLLFLLLGLAVLTSCKVAEVVQPYPSGDMLVAAHRGNHTDAPENSIPSITHAIAQDIDIVEIDVRVSKDGVPVLMHDEEVDRTTTGSGEVEAMAYQELARLYLLQDGKQTDHRIPTLKKALNAGKGKVIFDLDLKTAEMNKVIEVVEQTGSWKSVVFFDSDWKTLEQVRRAHPTWYVMPRAYNEEEAKKAYRKFKPWAIHVDLSFASPELSAYLHQRGIHVWINALGDVDDEIWKGNTNPLQQLLETKSSIIQTDRPLEIKQLVSHSKDTFSIKK